MDSLYLNEIEKINVSPVASCPDIYVTRWFPDKTQFLTAETDFSTNPRIITDATQIFYEHYAR
jgi:hypothetical protein